MVYVMRLSAALILALLIGLSLAQPPAVDAQENLAAALLSAGEAHQAIQFNPGAALQRRIFADGFVPNSPEWQHAFEGVEYAAQRAEHLGIGAVRIYYARVGDWGNVRYVASEAADGALAQSLLTQGQYHQVMQFNPTAALQRRIFGEGFVPNSAEFRRPVNGVQYVAQRAEHLGTGAVRVYYVVDGAWWDVRYVQRGAPGVPTPFPTVGPAGVFGRAMRPYPSTFMGSSRQNFVGRTFGPAREITVVEQVFGRYGDGSCSYPGSLFLWREDSREIYFLPVGTGTGLHPEACVNRWQVFVDTWRPGDPNNEDLTAPPGKLIPQRGFGKVWREQFYQASPVTLELPSAPEQARTAVVQQFENASLLYFADTGSIYVLFDRYVYLTRSGEQVGRAWFKVD